ncbi:MAG: HAD family phosphatase [Clostridia bacterium]|nr:HAD family phosphatase [Clostridia bacterium]
MNKKYAIFVMDGTLLDSMGYWNNLLEEFLLSKGIKEDATALIQQVKTMTVEQSSVMLAKRFPSLGNPRDFAEDAGKLMAKHYLEDIPLKDGVKEYLEKLRAQGVKMCVATITDRALLEVCFRRLGIDKYFDFTLSANECGKGKDDPEIYLAACRKFGSEPCDTAVFEDAPYALETARKAGFYTVAVYDDGEKNNWEKAKAAADEYIRDWKDSI